MLADYIMFVYEGFGDKNTPREGNTELHREHTTGTKLTAGVTRKGKLRKPRHCNMQCKMILYRCRTLLKELVRGVARLQYGFGAY